MLNRLNIAVSHHSNAFYTRACAIEPFGDSRASQDCTDKRTAPLEETYIVEGNNRAYIVVSTSSIRLRADVILHIGAVAARIAQLHMQQKADSNNNANGKTEAEDAEKECCQRELDHRIGAAWGVQFVPELQKTSDFVHLAIVHSRAMCTLGNFQ